MSFVVKELPRTTDYQTLNTAGLGAIHNNSQNGYQVQVPTQVQALQAHNLGLGVQPQDDPQRWSQYQHLWRQHVYNNINGMSTILFHHLSHRKVLYH